MNKLLSLCVAAMLCCSGAAALDIAGLEQAMANPDRPQADKDRDALRKAPEILDFMGVEAGMTALDIIAIGGWYTEVLAYAVGPSGKVYMQNNDSPFVERSADIIADRVNRLTNVEDYRGSIGDLPENSVDFAMTALNFHDVYNPSPAAAGGLFGQVFAAMKSGGVLAVIDHAGSRGADNVALHRITFEDTVASLTAVGFHLVGVSDLLHNADDDRSKGPFDPSLGRNTDRFVLKFMKP